MMSNQQPVAAWRLPSYRCSWVLPWPYRLAAGGGSSPSAGSGGGGVAPDVQTIQITQKSLAINAQKDISINSSTAVAVDLSPANFTSSTAADYKVVGDFTLTCNGVKQSSLTGTWVVAAGTPNTTSFAATSSVSFTGAPNAATCTIAGNVTATRGSVTSNTLPITATFTTVAALTCVAPTVAVKLGNTTVCASPVGVVINDSNFSKIPAGCGEVTHNPLDQCFQDFLPKVKFHETPAKATGAAISPLTNIANDGPVLFGCFIDKFDNTTCKIFLKDTGTIFANGGVNQATSHESLQVDRVFGSDKGSVTRIAQTGECFEMGWFPPTTQAGVSSNIWGNVKINCPALLK